MRVLRVDAEGSHSFVIGEYRPSCHALWLRGLRLFCVFLSAPGTPLRFCCAPCSKCTIANVSLPRIYAVALQRSRDDLHHFSRLAWIQKICSIPFAFSCSNVLNALRSLLKKPHSPWFGSTWIFVLLSGSSTGRGSGCFDIEFPYLRPVLRRADSPLWLFPSRFFLARTERAAVVEKEDR